VAYVGNNAGIYDSSNLGMCGTSYVWHIFQVIWDESGNVWHMLGITREYVTYMIEVIRECVARRIRGTIDVWHMGCVAHSRITSIIYVTYSRVIPKIDVWHMGCVAHF